MHMEYAGGCFSNTVCCCRFHGKPGKFTTLGIVQYMILSIYLAVYIQAHQTAVHMWRLYYYDWHNLSIEVQDLKKVRLLQLVLMTYYNKRYIDY